MIRETPQPSSALPSRVVIVGSGVAGLEAALAIDNLAGDRVEITLLTSEHSFVYRPLEVREPFAGAAAPHYELAELLRGTRVVIHDGTLAGVDPAGRTVWTRTAEALPYDMLVLALGAAPERSRPHVRLLQPGKLDESFHGFVQDVEEGYIRSAAFLVPDRIGWPLPLYEVLLMTAERGYESWSHIALTLVTSESAPLARFGSDASEAVTTRLAAAGVVVVTGAHSEVPTNGRVVIERAGESSVLTVDAVVGLPELTGPAIQGLPADEHGFVPIDSYGRVVGTTGVFAAGDMTDLPLKHGGAAAQMAEVVARGVAELAGVAVSAAPFAPDPGGVLLTGGRPLTIGRLAGVDATALVAVDPPKIAAPRLAARLALAAEQPRTREHAG